MSHDLQNEGYIHIGWAFTLVKKIISERTLLLHNIILICWGRAKRTRPYKKESLAA